jgi:tetratricopeptide (TPR) repeat protein
MKKSLLVIPVILLSVLCHAQDYPLTDSLKQNLSQARTAAEKIEWLGQLTDFYMNVNNTLADQYGTDLIEVAELSRDRGLMIKALLLNAERYFNSGNTQESMNKTKAFSERAFEIAKTSNREDGMAWSYIYLARCARNEGSYDKALNYNNLAVSLSTAQDDSLKISALISLGNTYMSRKEKLLAFRNFLQALNLAEEIKKYYPLKDCYYTMSYFYSELNDFEKAKDYLFKLQHLTYRFHKPYDRLHLYNALGWVYTKAKQYEMATGFYEKSMMLADTVKLEIVKLNSYFNILNQYLTSKQAEKALHYINGKRELKDFLVKANFDHYLYHAYALAYDGMARFDSSEYYFKKAEPGFLKSNPANQFWFYGDLARHYTKRNNYRKALEYWLKAKEIGDERKDLGMQKESTMNLDSVYQRLGDFKNAFYFNGEYHRYKDSLEKLSTEKDLLLLEVENENKRKEKEALLAEETIRARHNIQYMGITAAIAAVFIILVMLGLFSVSKGTVRVLGFFAFIFLFEFIILIADNQIHHWTHGEPWKILAIKIVLISILLPFHHFLEERVIHYLTTRKLIEINRKGLLNKLVRKTETDPALKS